MTGATSRSSARSAGDGRGVTGARQYHASAGLGGPLVRFPSPPRAVRQAAWANFRLIIAFAGGTVIERECKWGIPVHKYVRLSATYRANFPP